MNAYLEHTNFTVRNPDSTAKLLADIFGWEVRWSGPSLDIGYTVHLGTPGNGGTYLALYAPAEVEENEPRSHLNIANLNHVGVVVDDLDEIERRVMASGLATTNHGDYEPGRRFYFDLEDGVEIEVISYT